MRFKVPKYGAKRTKRIFLWYPREVDGEVRWLEFAVVEQTYNIGWEVKKFLNE